MTFADSEFADPGFGALRTERDLLRAALAKGHWEHGFKGEDGEWQWFDTDPNHVDDLLFSSDPETEWRQRYVVELSKAEAKEVLGDKRD